MINEQIGEALRLASEVRVVSRRKAKPDNIFSS